MKWKWRWIKLPDHPHLLFNTINNIDTWIQRDPVKASRLPQQICQDLMRFVLCPMRPARLRFRAAADRIHPEVHRSLQKIRDIQ